MSDARYLIRLGNRQHEPKDQALLLKRVREIVVPLQAKAINLRVSPSALEFDLFIEPHRNVAEVSSALAPVGPVLTTKRLDVPPAPVDPHAVVTEARRLFNEQRFWEVHEVLEGLWKDLKKGPEKELVQGLILAAAALVHVQKDEPAPVWPMLQDALRRLSGRSEAYYGWDVVKFRNYFQNVVTQKKIEIPTV